MADKSLADMTQDEALEYLRGLDSVKNIGTITATGGTNEYDPTFYTDATGKEIRAGEGGDYYRAVSPMFDPNYAGGTYGYYEGIYDKDGNLKDVQFRKGERHQGFLSENLETIGPLVVGGAMGLGGGLFGGLGNGISEAALGELGINTSLPAGTVGGVSGITDAALGELGINTSLPMGTQGGVYAPSGIEALNSGLPPGTVEFDFVPPGEEALTNLSETVTPPTQASPPTSTIPPGAEPTNYGIQPGIEQTGAATAPQLSTLDSAKEFLKNLGIKDLKTALQMGLLGTGLVQLLASKSASGNKGVGSGGGMQLRTPVTYSRTPNPQAKYMTAADARAYMQGQPGTSSKQQSYFNQGFTKGDMYDARTGETYVKDPRTGQLISKSALDEASKQAGLASGGIAALAGGGAPSYPNMFDGSTLGSYSDGGRLLRGPGDGVSDSIPAVISGKHPARLADGEFVVPARIVSELGNGSTEAGARKLYKMMDRIQSGRRKTVGKNAVAKDSKADKHLPA